MSVDPLKCVWCGRFIAYNDVHYYQPPGPIYGTEPYDVELECGPCHRQGLSDAEPEEVIAETN